MNYTKKQLGQYIDVLSGFAFKSKDFTNVGIPVIKIKNINPPYVSLEDISCVPISVAYQNPKYILKRGDVLIAMTGSHINQIASVVGRVGRVRYDDLTVLNQRVGKIINKNDEYSNLDYIYYFLSQYDVKVELAQKAGGAANQANISPSDIKNLYFPCPPIEIQNKIATILSRYDSLIENYQKQIKLLEESAQRLYKEWFIDLHFPGHKNTQIVDGVPEGWEKKRLADIAELKAGGDKPDIVSDVRTEDCAIPIFSNGTTNEGLYGFTKVPEIMEHCVTISARGSVGYTVLRRTPFVPIVRLISVIPHNVYVGYIFYYLKSTTLDSNGAAQQQITIPMIRNKEITIPSKGILEIFESQTEPIFNQIDIIKDQIRHLTEARDRLLPKLMSGEIEV